MLPPEDIYNRLPYRSPMLSSMIPGVGTSGMSRGMTAPSMAGPMDRSGVPMAQPAAAPIAPTVSPMGADRPMSPNLSSIVDQAPQPFDMQAEAQRRAAESMNQFHDTLMQLREGPETYNIMGQSHPGANNSLSWDDFQAYWKQNPFVSHVMGGGDPAQFYMQDMQNRPTAYAFQKPNQPAATPTLSNIIRRQP